MILLKFLKDINSIPESARGAVNFHGGGYNNHGLFWNTMKNGEEPDGELADGINKTFGFNDFKDKFSKDTVAIQGSGWGGLYTTRILTA